MFWIIIIGAYIIFYACVLTVLLYHKRVNTWVPQYMGRLVKGHRRNGPIHLLVLIANIFDPYVGGASREEGCRRMVSWERRMAEIASRYRDSDGNPPQHTWFVPIAMKDTDCLFRISKMCFDGFGEIGIYIPPETNHEAFHNKLKDSLQSISQFGGCVIHDKDKGRRNSFGVIGDENNSTIPFLPAEGCYADFTGPPIEGIHGSYFSQIYHYLRYSENTSHIIDPSLSIYRESSSPLGLMMIPGSVGINWFDWSNLFFPNFETGSVCRRTLPYSLRTRLWIRSAAALPGRPDWIVIKLFTRGCEPANEEILLGKYTHRIYKEFERFARGGHPCYLHYVSGRELYNIIRAAESGCSGNPHMMRDWQLPPFVNQRVLCTRPFVSSKVSSYEVQVAIRENGYSRIFFNSLPLVECSGNIKTLAVTMDADRKHMRLKLTGHSRAAIKGIFTEVPVNVSGAKIKTLHPVQNGKHTIELETDIRGSKEIVIDTHETCPRRSSLSAG